MLGVGSDALTCWSIELEAVQTIRPGEEDTCAHRANMNCIQDHLQYMESLQIKCKHALLS